MEAIRLHTLVEKDGEIVMRGLPFKKGQQIEVFLVGESESGPEVPHMTAQQLLESGLVGLWQDRTDIQDSVTYARQLREGALRQKDDPAGH